MIWILFIAAAVAPLTGKALKDFTMLAQSVNADIQAVNGDASMALISSAEGQRFVAIHSSRLTLADKEASALAVNALNFVIRAQALHFEILAFIEGDHDKAEIAGKISDFTEKWRAMKDEVRFFRASENKSRRAALIFKIENQAGLRLAIDRAFDDLSSAGIPGTVTNTRLSEKIEAFRRSFWNAASREEALDMLVKLREATDSGLFQNAGDAEAALQLKLAEEEAIRNAEIAEGRAQAVEPKKTERRKPSLSAIQRLDRKMKEESIRKREVREAQKKLRDLLMQDVETPAPVVAEPVKPEPDGEELLDRLLDRCITETDATGNNVPLVSDLGHIDDEWFKHPCKEALSGEYLALADTAESEGRVQEAIDMYVTAVDAFPDNADALSSLSRLYEMSNQYQLAVHTLRHLIKVDPDMIYEGRLANDLFLLGEYDEAERHILDALYRDANCPAHWYTLGVIRFMKHDYHEAESAFTRAIELAPAIPGYHYYLSESIRRIVDEDAGEISDPVRSGQSDDKDDRKTSGEKYTIGMALALHDRGRFDEAEHAYRYLLDVDRESHTVWYFLGTLLEEMGRLKEAELAYRAALFVNHGFRPASDNLHALVNRFVSERRPSSPSGPADASSSFSKSGSSPQHPAFASFKDDILESDFALSLDRMFGDMSLAD